YSSSASTSYSSTDRLTSVPQPQHERKRIACAQGHVRVRLHVRSASMQLESDDLAREIAESAAEVSQLKALIDEQSAGASDEWIAAARRALRLAQQRLTELQGSDDRADSPVHDATGT